MSSGNADKAFVSNCDHYYNWCVFKALCSVPIHKRATQYYGINAAMDIKKASQNGIIATIQLYSYLY